MAWPKGRARKGSHITTRQSGAKRVPQGTRPPPTLKHQNQTRTKVWRHPDREIIHTLLQNKAAGFVERWLEVRYPPENESGVPVPKNAALRINRSTLIKYRDKYLVDAGFREPINDSPLETVLPPRVPYEKALWEMDVLETRVHAAEAVLAKCLQADAEMSMVQEITVDALRELGAATLDRADLAMRLGLPGYEAAPEKLEIDQRVTGMHMNVHLKANGERPLEPERFELAKMMAEMPTEARRQLIAEKAGALMPTGPTDRLPRELGSPQIIGDDGKPLE